jgi:hypothetical protein
VLQNVPQADTFLYSFVQATLKIAETAVLVVGEEEVEEVAEADAATRGPEHTPSPIPISKGVSRYE